MSIKKILSYAAVFICGIFVTSMLFQLPFAKNYSTSDVATQENSLSGGKAIADYASPEVAQDNAATSSERMAQGNVIYDNVFNKDKIIYQGAISLDVKDSQKATADIKKAIEANGGFVESSYTNQNETNDKAIYLNQSFIVIRVPSVKFDETMESLKKFGEETSTNINSTNISSQYRDIKSEQKSLEIQQERLLNYLKEAKKIEDMITIETELNRVRTNLNSINTQLNNYDQLISYSSITVNLTEAQMLTTTIKSPFGKLLDNISKGFISSINLLLQVVSFLIVLVFRLIPFVIVILPIAWIIKKYVLKR